MGSYAGIRGRVNNWVTEDKREEFEQKIEKLFVAGGMTDIIFYHILRKNF